MISKKKFYTKHKGTYKKLKMDHIICSFVIFKCNFAMEDQDDVNDHYRKVHNFSDGGVFHLRRREKIDINMTLPFQIPDFKEFQSMGPNKQTAMINKIYNHCVSRGVVEDTSNKNEATLLRSRSSEFLTEMKRSSSQNYYDRFKFYLSQIVDTDIDDGFVCVWKNIEGAMYSAVGKENKVNRLYNLIDINPADFHTKPLEILIGEVF